MVIPSRGFHNGFNGSPEENHPAGEEFGGKGGIVMRIIDLEYWPPPVWRSKGSTGIQPNCSTAVIKDVQLSKQEFLGLAIEDEGREFQSNIGPVEEHLARRICLTLRDAIGKTLSEAETLTVHPIRHLRLSSFVAGNRCREIYYSKRSRVLTR